MNSILHLSQILYELEKKSSLVIRALSAKSCTHYTDSLHSCTRLRLVQEMACPYHSCKIWPRKHSYPNLIPIGTYDTTSHQACWGYTDVTSTFLITSSIIIDIRRTLYPWNISSHCCATDSYGLTSVWCQASKAMTQAKHDSGLFCFFITKT